MNSMKQTAFWSCFLTEDSFNGLKHLMEKVTRLTTEINDNKVKILHRYYHKCLYQSSIKKHFQQAFFYIIFSLKMFIVNGKSHCCNDTFTDILFTSLPAKNI